MRKLKRLFYRKKMNIEWLGQGHLAKHGWKSWPHRFKPGFDQQWQVGNKGQTKFIHYV